MKKKKACNICKACGTRFDILKKECPVCGLKIDETTKVHFCTMCGKPLESDSRVCDSCLSKKNKTSIKKKIKYTMAFSHNTGWDKALYVFGSLLIFSSSADQYILRDKVLVILLGLSLFKILYELFSDHIYPLNDTAIKFFRIVIPFIILLILAFTSPLSNNEEADNNIKNDNSIKENIVENTTTVSIVNDAEVTTVKDNEDVNFDDSDNNSIINSKNNGNNKSNNSQNENSTYVDNRKDIVITLVYQDKSKKEIKIKEGDSYTVPVNNDSKTVSAGTVYFHPCIEACGPGDGFETIYSSAKYEIVPDGWQDVLNKSKKYKDGDIIYPSENLSLKTVFKETGNIISASFPKVSKEGFTFGGWWTNPYCSGVQNIDEYYVGIYKQNYYACWIKND